MPDIIKETRRYQYVKMLYVGPVIEGNGHIWDVYTNTGKLWMGTIVYSQQHKDYVFEPSDCTEFSAQSLKDIVSFMEEQQV